VRQTFRLLAQYQEQGAGGLVDKARGRASNRQVNARLQRSKIEVCLLVTVRMLLMPRNHDQMQE
jgi:hypothetical protein